MTVLTKTSITIKKSPLINEDCDNDLVINVDPQESVAQKKRARAAQAGRSRRVTTSVLFAMLLGIFLLAMLGIFTTMQIYEQLRSVGSSQHYHGYCSIPMPKDIQMLESRKVALRWRAADEALSHTEPDMQAVTVGEDVDVQAILSEMLDINVDDSLERIAVYKNGHPVSFLHDFESNITGIVDEERCFLMDMDQQNMLSPQLFIVGLQQGEEFDVGMVRSSLQAVMPAVKEIAHSMVRGLAEKCSDRPTYKLEKKLGTVIRKRAADEPPHDYIQFAGKNVQHLEISNLPDLLHHEQTLKQLA